MPSDTDSPPLSTELELAMLERLRRDYRRESWTRFESRLQLPPIRVTDSRTMLAAWSRADRTLEISRRLLLEVPWTSVVEVLKHEMAHQFVHEHLFADEPAHGETFQRVCRERGIDAAAHGVPAPSAPGEADEAVDRVREKVRRLLALAASSNPHEAELAMLRAREILLRYNLEHTEPRERYEVRWLGAPRRRVSRAEYVLAGILARHFHVEVLWIDTYQPREGREGTLLEVCGTASNVEMAEYVHAFLLRAAERAWEARRAELGGRARQAFLAGVMHGFAGKLDGQRQQLSGTGLVWAGDAALCAWHERRHPKRRRVGRATTTQWSAHLEGRREGAQIVLSRPLSRGPSGKTHLLSE